MKRAIAIALLCVSTIVAAQPAPDPGSGSAPDVGSGSAPDVGSGSAGSGSAGSGSAGSGSAGSGSAGGGSSAGSGAGSGTGAGSGPVMLDLPTDINAPQVTAAATPTIVRLGGTFSVVIRATYADGVEVNLREPLELGGAFEVKRKLSENKKSSGGRTTREWEVEVIAWELGDLVMPGITVTYTAFGKAGQVETNRIRLKITGVLGDVVDDPKAMRGNTPPAELVARDWFWLWVAAAVGAVIGAAIGLLVYRNKRRRRVTNLVAGVMVRPRRIDMTSERALERLLAIEKSGILEREDDRKAGYLEMIEVIRDYLGQRYHVATSELTTSELSRRLERVAPEEERLLVEAWLDACDLVRYGGLRTTAKAAHQTLDDARALVVTTTQMQEAARANLVASQRAVKPEKKPDEEAA
ncbi:MAG: hypothetical protein M4D80_06560 [Myxococcota bacterium]|nr:hypothetical protein [Myxococcota bacterium]